MHLGGAGVEEHLDDLARRRAAHDRVVDDHEPLARDLGERVELHPDPLLAHALLGLDERPVHVAVLDQALAERDAGRAREADRGRRARSRGSAGRGRPRRAPRLRAARPSGRARRGPRRRRAACRAGRGRRTRRCRARPAPACWIACIDSTRPRRRSRARRAGSRARRSRRRGRARTSRRRRRDRRRAGRARAAGSRAGRGRRRACPSARPTTVAAPSSRAIAAGDRLVERPLVARDHGGDHLAVGGRAKTRRRARRGARRR